jgi:hypothetical protein
MRFNIFTFLIGRLIAQNRGVPAGVATTDGFVAGILRPPILGIVLVSAIARNQAAALPALPAAQGPSLDPKTPLDPPKPLATTDVTVTGTKFGTDATAITVVFSFPAANPTTTIAVALPKDTPITVAQNGQTSFDLTLPDGLPAKQDIGFVVAVAGVPSNSATFQLG